LEGELVFIASRHLGVQQVLLEVTEQGYEQVDEARAGSASVGYTHTIDSIQYHKQS